MGYVFQLRRPLGKKKDCEAALDILAKIKRLHATHRSAYASYSAALLLAASALVSKLRFVSLLSFPYFMLACKTLNMWLALLALLIQSQALLVPVFKK